MDIQDRVAQQFNYRRDDRVAEGAQSVHPSGYAMSHSALLRLLLRRQGQERGELEALLIAGAGGAVQVEVLKFFGLHGWYLLRESMKAR